MKTMTKIQQERSVNIIIRGTTKDVRLIKKVFKAYLVSANKTEKHHIELYLELIENAVIKALSEDDGSSE